MRGNPDDLANQELAEIYEALVALGTYEPYFQKVRIVLLESTIRPTHRVSPAVSWILLYRKTILIYKYIKH